MAVGLYMDHNVPRAIALALRLRDVDVLTAVEDGSHELSDPDLLDRASALGRALFTRDDDLLAEGARRQREGRHFQEIILAHPSRSPESSKRLLVDGPARADGDEIDQPSRRDPVDDSEASHPEAPQPRQLIA
jgi:predicted nuclease of predicted toxin-antitoxin system